MHCGNFFGVFAQRYAFNNANIGIRTTYSIILIHNNWLPTWLKFRSVCRFSGSLLIYICTLYPLVVLISVIFNQFTNLQFDWNSGFRPLWHFVYSLTFKTPRNGSFINSFLRIPQKSYSWLEFSQRNSHFLGSTF